MFTEKKAIDLHNIGSIRKKTISYIEKNIMPNENILYSARVHPAVFIPATTLFVCTILMLIPFVLTKDTLSLIFAIICFIFTLRFTVEAIIIMLNTEFAITNRRIIAKTGFFHRKTLEMLLTKIESVSIYQNLGGRMMNFGSVTVIGTGGTKETFKVIIDPQGVRRKVNQVIEHYVQVNNKPTS